MNSRLIFQDKFITLYLLRFAAIFAHSFFTILLYQSVHLNVEANLGPTASPENRAKTEEFVYNYVTTSLICLCADSIFFAWGVSLNMPRVTLANALFHGFGAFFTLWAMLDAWGWHSILVIFHFFTLPPFVIEFALCRPWPTVAREVRRFGRKCSQFREDQVRRPSRPLTAAGDHAL